MGISKMQKVLLLVHRSEKEELIETLQNKGVLHITNLKETPLGEDYPDLFPEEEVTDRGLEELIARLKRSVDYLDRFTEKGFLGMGGEGRVMVSQKDYETIASTYDASPVLERCEGIERRYVELESQRTSLRSQIDLLSPWLNLDIPVEEIGPTREAVTVAGVIPDGGSREELVERVAEAGATCEVVKEEPKHTYCLIAYLRGDERISGLFKEIGFEPFDFRGLNGRPREIVARLERRLEEIEAEEKSSAEEIGSLTPSRPKLSILHDHYLNLLSRRRVDNLSLSTREVVAIEGWVRKRDYQGLESSVSRFESVSLSRAQPYPGESPPIDLENRRLFKPFEVITELYGMPNHRELDPTPFLAPFFALFFGLCLTDAGYGFLVALLAFLFMNRLRGGRKLLQLLLISGLVTIAVGALTGGWFGDLFDRLPLGWLKRFRSSMMLFDPMQEPMVFFGLATGLGFFQVIFGHFVELYDDLRRRQFLQALFGPVSWLVLLGSGVLFATGLLGLLPKSVVLPAVVFFLISSLLILVFGAREEKSPMLRGLFGGIKWFFGMTGTMGDVLSYVRLMALGMVTGGIAMAVNVIAELVIPIPVLGVVLAIGVLVGGHLFNMAIGVMGGFMHTMRLQYVEFFTKFFEGGGRVFGPFSRQFKYTTIKG